MNYPVWIVPVIGSGWVIGIIAIIHIVLSHFAVGGGFYLALAERKALREKRDDWLAVLKKHSKFFLIITAVLGAITGVGIWFAIGLASPEATSALIHNFVLAWAMEWTLFLVEVTSIIVYYYTWNRISERAHMAVAWIYGISAWFSLFIINGILTFMLDPGSRWLEVAGTGQEPSAFWSALFNPTYMPSLVIRTLIAVVLTGLFALVTASRIDGNKNPALKESVVKWSAKWLMPSFFLLPFALAWYLSSVPEQNRKLLRIGISTIGAGIFTQITRNGVIVVVGSLLLFGVVYFFAWKNSRRFTTAQAIVILILALGVTGATEQMREMLRKPYVIGGYMYSNGVRTYEVNRFNEQGYLARTSWASEDEKAAWQRNDMILSAESNIEAGVIPGGQFDYKAHLRRGELMVRGQCMPCHTISKEGYRSLYSMLKERNRESISNIIDLLKQRPEDSNYRLFMPPLAGTKREIEALKAFLIHLTGAKSAEESTPVSQSKLQSGTNNTQYYN